MEFMLETIADIKNNKKRAKEDTPQHTRMKKWLQKVFQIDVLTVQFGSGPGSLRIPYVRDSAFGHGSRYFLQK